MFKLLPDERPSWAPTVSTLLDLQAPLAESGPKDSTGSERVDIYAATMANEWLCGIGTILRLKQEAVNLFPEAARAKLRLLIRRAYRPRIQNSMKPHGFSRTLCTAVLTSWKRTSDVVTEPKRQF